MKKYRIYTARPVNANISKKGYKWEYRKKVNESEINAYQEWVIDDNYMTRYAQTFGIKIVDAETKESIYEYLNERWLANHQEENERINNERRNVLQQ